MKTTLLDQHTSFTPAQAIFRQDVIRGLSAPCKYLQAKYFYDASGDELFRRIMDSPEYYPTPAEREILSQQGNRILDACRRTHPSFDIVELGAGDASKSVYLLQAALERGLSDQYYPIDISGNIIGYLQQTLPAKLPGLKVQGLEGEYFDMLGQLRTESRKPRLVLFLGATIGNMPPAEALDFCKGLHDYLQPGDLLLMGFDLKKDPDVVLAAYNDKEGITREFNFNLLRRINRELGGDFDTTQFRHYPVYDPGTGACKSYLISRKRQQVRLSGNVLINFEQDEPVFMEISQKYSLPEIDEMAALSGFQTVARFPDSRRLFADVLWQI